MFKCLAWLLLYCLKLTHGSRSASTQVFRERVKTIPLREEKGEEVVAKGFSPVSPCINGCIGPSLTGGKEKGSCPSAGFDPWATSICLGGKGHDEREMGYPGKPPMD